jgi:tRNA U34 2-thiouridine synthase MnmA/TrmU
VAAKVRTYTDENGADAMQVRFIDPVEAVTPGQAVVCYGKIGSPLEQTVLGGGWINEAIRA